MTALRKVFSVASLSAASLSVATLLFSAAGQAAEQEPVKVKKWKVSFQLAILNSDAGQHNYTGLGFFREFKNGIFSGISYLSDLENTAIEDKELTDQMLWHIGYGQAFDQNVGYRLSFATGIALGEYVTGSDISFKEPCSCRYTANHTIVEAYYLKSASREFAVQARYMSIGNEQIDSGFGFAASYRFRF